MSQHSVSGNGKDSEWSINAFDLAWFWTCAYPRIVGSVWSGAIDESRFVDPTYTREIINAFIADLGKKMGIGHDDRDFFPDTMNVRIMDGINYEFIIHDKGVLLPLPRKPLSAEDVYRAYVYRKVGTPGMRIPGQKLGHYYSVDSANAGALNPDGAFMNYLRTSALLPEGENRSAPQGFGVAEIMTLFRYLVKQEFRWEWYLMGNDFMKTIVALPRVIADIWLEQSVYDSGADPSTEERPQAPYRRRFNEEPLRLLGERGEMITTRPYRAGCTTSGKSSEATRASRKSWSQTPSKATGWCCTSRSPRRLSRCTATGAAAKRGIRFLRIPLRIAHKHILPLKSATTSIVVGGQGPSK